MKTARKAILLVLCAILLVVSAVMGTLAYLTDTEDVTNTFTVGKVDITLDEAPVDADGQKTTGDRVKSNTYHLLPGGTYDKDPMVTVLKGSDESYVRMIVTATFDSELTTEALAFDLDELIIGYQQTDWPRELKTVETKTKTVQDDEGKDVEQRYTVITYEYRYKDTVSAKDADLALAPLFTHIDVPNEFNNAQIAVLNAMTLNIKAEAIQAAGFDATGEKSAADVAWEAFADQVNS